MKVAVFGGSFDPPHAAHVMLAAYVLSVCDVDRLTVVPTFDHPLAKRIRSRFEHRVRMCELAFADLSRVSISRVEEELAGQSYTLHTLEELHRRQPEDTFRLVIGADILDELTRWHRFHRVAELAPPIVVGRSGYAASAGFETLPLELPAISSTEVRARMDRGEDVEGLVPRAVARYAAEHRLYGAAP